MKTKLNYAEIDELLYYARLEAQFAEASVLEAKTCMDRVAHAERYANAKLLEEKLGQMRTQTRGDRHEFLLPGAVVFAQEVAARSLDGNVVRLADYRPRHASAGR